MLVLYCTDPGALLGILRVLFSRRITAVDMAGGRLKGTGVRR